MNRGQWVANIKRFPKDFMFELTRDEIMGISQIVTSSQIKYSKRVHAFTEQGVAMLSSVLKSERAIEVNIAIMRTFVRLRQMLASNKKLARKIEEMEKKYDEQFQVVFEAIKQLMAPPEKPKKGIGFLWSPYFSACDSLPAIASAQARRAGQNRFNFHREENSLWLNSFDLVGNFHIDWEESERILKDVKRIEGAGILT